MSPKTALSSTTLFRVACGGQGGFDSFRLFWAPDSNFTGGSTWTNLGQQPPFQNLRFAPSFSYTFPAAPGQYQITFKFLEPNQITIGKRLFNVIVNGFVEILSLDLYATLGMNLPITKTIQVTNTQQVLVIQFLGLVGNAVVSGIQVDRLDDPAKFNSIVTYEGRVSREDLTSDTFEQEITIIEQLPAEFVYIRVLLEIVTRFLGHTTMECSMGRPGTNNYELIGAFFDLTQPDGFFWQSVPGSPQLHDFYDIVIYFKSSGSVINNATTGELRWQICGFLPKDEQADLS